jgi:2-furoyl-CoA dehydrogenase 2Fe-2S iron sulfur subunit
MSSLRTVPDQEIAFAFRLNNRALSGRTEARVSLADFLRHDRGCYGVRVGCEHGICGACTVLIDNVPARSCLTLAVQADGAEVRTVEGLAERDGTLSILQSAFSRHHALQCGFCTAGILMSATWLLAQGRPIDEAGVRDLLSGHLCRCTGYAPIIAAILDAAGQPTAAARSTDEEPK